MSLSSKSGLSTLFQAGKLQAVILCTIFLFFATVMTVKGCANIFLALLLLLCIPLIKRGNRWQWGVFLALALPFTLYLLQYVFGFSPKINGLDAPSRFVLAGITLFALIQLDRKKLSYACYGAILGALGVGVWGYLSTQFPAFYWMDGSRGTNSFSNPIAFGTISLFLGFISLILPVPKACQNKKLSLFIIFIKVSAFFAGIAAGYASGSRVSVLIFIPLLFIALIGATKFNLKKALLGCLLAALAATAFIESHDNQLRTRIHEGFAEVMTTTPDPNSSMGRRLVMWQIALGIIKEHPVMGIGKGNLNAVMAKQNYMESQYGEPIYFSHPHNEILTMTVDVGVFGLLSGILLYLVPGVLFISRLRDEDRYVRFAATAGSMVVVGFFLAGQMDSYFWIVSQTAFYGVCIALFAAMLLSKTEHQPNPAGR
ncbi:MAG: O-antigen ligase family protein [Enterobacteriaceae bacterium]